MKLVVYFTLCLFLASCATSNVNYSRKGKTDEEKLYYMTLEDFEAGNYTLGHGRARKFEDKFPKSKHLCEIVALKGDARVQFGYHDVALKEYKEALSVCKKQNNKKLTSSLTVKIKEVESKLKDDK